MRFKLQTPSLHSISYNIQTAETDKNVMSRLNHSLMQLNSRSLYINNGDMMQIVTVQTAAVWLGHNHTGQQISVTYLVIIY